MIEKNKILKRISVILTFLILFNYILPLCAYAVAEKDKDAQAPVPAAVAKVLEGITTIQPVAGADSSGVLTVANYPETGDGYTSLTKVNGTVYKNYKQFLGSYAGISFSSGTISSSRMWTSISCCCCQCVWDR